MSCGCNLSHFERVRNWMVSIGQRVFYRPVKELDGSTKNLRIKLIAEELEEYIEANGGYVVQPIQWILPSESLCFVERDRATTFGNYDPIQIADSLGDLEVVVLGGGAAHGIPMDEVFDEVQKSNDSKVIDGYMRESDGKWQKGPSFVEPNLSFIMGDGSENNQ